jgi:hypothetical protein
LLSPTIFISLEASSKIFLFLATISSFGVGGFYSSLAGAGDGSVDFY